MKNLKLHFRRFLALSLLILGFISDGSGQLPEMKDIKKSYGLVNVSVCNMRSSPEHSTELISQALMGTPVKIFRQQRGWSLIQTPDLYRGWVDNAAISVMDSSDIESWKRSKRLIYLKKYGDIFTDISERQIVSDIVAGSILSVIDEKNKFWYVNLPDGRKGFLRKEDATLFRDWAKSKEPVGSELKKLAKTFTGIPYLWGGTSSKAFDCSGFVKTIYYLNGIILKRDASQQYMHGIKISKEHDTDSLKSGDLLFFGSEKNGTPKPTHVAMYIGETKYIHASGMVKINSLDPSENDFSSDRKNSYLGARRIINAEPDEGIIPISKHNAYF